MILKGNQRGGGQNLATHLMNEFSNDRVEVLDLDGSVAQDLHGAFAEWYAQSKATKGKKYLFSLSVNPDEKQRRLTSDEYRDLADRVGKKLQLAGRPRAIVIHEKQDQLGIPRQHAHIVWSRTDTEQSKFVHLSEYKLKLRAVAREFAKDHDLDLPKGMANDGLKDRFKRKAEASKLPEIQQEERSGIKKTDRMPSITDAWNTTRTGEEFIRALAASDYFLARGDKRSYVIVDLAGEIHSLSRQIEGVKAAAIKARLSALPPEKLAGVERAQEHARQLREHRKALQEKERAPVEAEGPTPNERRAALRQQQQARRLALDAEREKLTLRHAKEQGGLAILQASANAGIVGDRQQKKPTGLTAFLTRITGISLIVDIKQKREDKERERQQVAETEALWRRQDSESRDTDRRRQALDRIERREARSLETAIRREEFQKIAAPAKDREKTGDTGKARPPDKEAYVPTSEQAAKLAAFGDAGRDITIKAPPKLPKKPSRLAGIFNRFAVLKDGAPARMPEKTEPPKPDPRGQELAPEETLRGDFNAAAGGATPEPPAPEPTFDSLADQFRRAAESRDRDRDFDDPDNGREKNYRRQPLDRTVRR